MKTEVSLPPPPLLLAHRRRGIVLGAFFLILLLAGAGISDPYTANLLIITLLFAGLAQSWNLLGGWCGQISLGHALYFGLGAYLTTLGRLAHFPTLTVLPAAAGLGGLAALLIGLPVFRFSGHHYAIATLVIAEAFYLLFLNWDGVGAASGLFVSYQGESWLDLSFRTSKFPYFLATWLYAAGVTGLAWALAAARLGYDWQAVREDPFAAESLGIGVHRAKLKAALLSGACTALGGGLYAAYVNYVDPDSVMASRLSIEIALPAVMGGVGTLWGPLLGAAVEVPVSEFSRSYMGGSGQGFDFMVYGGLIMAIALFRPEGLISVFTGLRRRGRPS
jgi:branched-chain amino acid transport system permease protein